MARMQLTPPRQPVRGPFAMGQRTSIVNMGLLAALPLLIVALVVLWRDAQEKQRQVAAEHEHRAQVAALTVDAFIGEQLAAVHAVAITLPPFDPTQRAEATATLDRLVAENPYWLGTALIGPDGWDLGVASPGNFDTLYVGDRPYFQQVMATGQPTVSDGIIGRVNHVPTVPLASPLKLRSGERGMLFVTFPIARLAGVLRPQVETETAQVVVVDRLGQTIVSRDADRLAPLANLVGNPSVDVALAGASGSRVAEWNGVESLIAYAPVPQYGWGVLVVEPTTAAFAAARQDAMHDLGFISLSLVMLVAIAAFFRRRLAAAFRANARLYQEVQRAVLIRDELLAGVSHDLRSPLAGIKLTAEVLRRRIPAGPWPAATESASESGPVLPQELAPALARIEETCRYMDDLIGGLLDVAQLQMGQPLRLQRAPTDLVPLVGRVVAAYQETTDRTANRPAITFVAQQPVAGEWDAARLRRVVDNLVGNAVKYSPAGGAIHVALDRDATGPVAAAVLTVADAGIGIPADDLPHIFERFRRGSNVAGIAPGTGIGLAGAQQIIQQHGGTIAVASELGQGTQVTIRLPLAR